MKLLAQREHSRTELRRKLLPHAIAACEGRAQEHAQPAGSDSGSGAEMPEAAEAPGPCLDRLLDWLEAHAYLSAERFVESRVHARAARFGQRRIALELAQHGLTLDADTAAALKGSEFSRALSVWQRRFGEAAATDRTEQARQARFLAARGFSAEVIRRIVQGLDEAE